jgi:hypothetical protein
MAVKIKRVFWLVLLLFVSCEQNRVDLPDVADCEHYYYEDCNTQEPFEAEVKFLFSINRQTHFVIFEVYKGTVDEGTLFFTDTAVDASVSYIMPVGEYFSALATYQVDGKTIKVIDGGKLIKQGKTVCDSTCWGVNELVLDLSIRQ